MKSEFRVDPETDALIVVHVQRDFCPGGALPVPHGDEVVPVLNEWLRDADLAKFATRDWHPPNHCSFQRRGGPWPDHCVQNTPGAEFHPGLRVEAIEEIFSGATDPEKEAYSGFSIPELAPALRRRGIRRLWIGGLAADYCVKATALDGRAEGFEIMVIEDAVRGIEATPGDCERARREMVAAGIRFVRSRDVQKKANKVPALCV